jgi:hypothetical protein
VQKNEEKCDDSKEDFNEELEEVCHHFPRYHMNIIVGDFMQKWVERIFSNRQVRIKLYNRVLMIMVSEK